jgi:hypothetical protein
VTRIKGAEATAQSRRIEAAGEADSRRQLADAEAYRQERLGKVASDQLARDGALIDKHPLLIQKTMADKLSDKISVIIAPPPRDGGFIGATPCLVAARAARAPAAGREASDDLSGRRKWRGRTMTMLATALTVIAIVTQDQAGLRAAPRESAAQHAVLWQGDSLEIRGAKGDYLQVYDHRRERAGYVRYRARFGRSR